MQLAMTAAAGHRTDDEFREALEQLGDAGWLRLRTIATALAARAPVEAKDLLHDGIVAVAEGGRTWPQDVDFFPFMRGVMCSLASGEVRNRAKSQIRSPQSLFAKDGSLAVDPADAQPDPEHIVMSVEEWEQVRQDLYALFEGDDEAGLILIGLADGKDGEELRAETGLDRTAFATKRKLVRRKLNAYWAGRARQ